MPRERWFGFIKDYEGGTLMECVINQKLDYTRARQFARLQREVRSCAACVCGLVLLLMREYCCKGLCVCYHD